MLDLVPWFDERYIRDESDWERVLYPNLQTFLHAAAADPPCLRLALDAHVTLAFAAGSILNIKSGARWSWTSEARAGRSGQWTIFPLTQIGQCL